MHKTTVAICASVGFLLAMGGPAAIGQTVSGLPALENGDVNGDWQRDLSDATYLLGYLYLGGPGPVPLHCEPGVLSTANGDANADGNRDVSDAVHLLNWLFSGGASPQPICGLNEGLAGKATQRSIEEFVAAQGSECFLPKIAPLTCADISASEVDGCCLFVPPIRNFFGWFDPSNLNFLSMDYAGKAEEWMQRQGSSLGTTTSGSVSERELPDGRAEIHVRLLTTNALAWAFVFDPSIPGNPFANTPLSFGHRAPDVLDGADPALGDCLLHAVFINAAPGDPLPDLLQIANFPEPGQEFVTASFYGKASGTFREHFGVEEGTPGFVQTTQTNVVTPSQSPSFDTFPAEHVHLQVTSN